MKMNTRFLFCLYSTSNGHHTIPLFRLSLLLLRSAPRSFPFPILCCNGPEQEAFSTIPAASREGASKIIMLWMSSASPMKRTTQGCATSSSQSCNFLVTPMAEPGSLARTSRTSLVAVLLTRATIQYCNLPAPTFTRRHSIPIYMV
jgi:hypothetical protein